MNTTNKTLANDSVLASSQSRVTAPITLALSKGRIFDETLPLLKAAGLEVLENPEHSR